ncbi:MAG TPA: hypothetical protein VLG69_02545 [Candidatus Andersenbacteria bacterium]|nr:hypothetical protein [Candidatus Andersenbacteria bacterium]
MNNHVITKNNTNTSPINALLADPLALEIAEVVSREELSFQELSEITHENKKKLEHELDVLSESRILKQHQQGDHITYYLCQPQIAQTVHILYRLWANSVVAQISGA